jgi:pescadillo protein
MAKERKKGKKGEAAQYVTRAQALKKLQISLADFRRLCILKGIFPRDPKKKPAGKDKTYFHIKDVRYLLHEPLLDKFLKEKTFMKKFKRLVGRKEKETAKRYEELNKPQYTLNHLVKERYPKFEDAVRDLDDALSTCALFDTLPVDKRRDIPPEAIYDSARVMSEFQLFCIRERRLRKVFASIKGYYFQVDISGVLVTWLCPHRFTQGLPAEVDFKVMLTFLDLHRTVLKFVNYRLFTQAGVKYPPTVEHKAKIHASKVAALKVELFDDQMKPSTDVDVEKAVQDDFGDVEEVKEMQKKSSAEKRQQSVFQGLTVYIGRECPFDPLYFCLRACGAEVGWSREGSPFGEDAENVTHQIVDRPMEQIMVRPGREYVQPQWVFDCVNEGARLAIGDYVPGHAPPPHLSPFVDHEVEGYVPERRQELSRLVGDAIEEENDDDADDAEAEDVEALAQAEVEAELAGVASSEKVNVKTTSRKKKAAAAEAEEEERLKSMMTKKHKRMLLRINQRESTKDDKVKKLVEKRAKAEKGTAK